MEITDYIPVDILKPFIKAYKIIESEEEVVNRVLPNTSFAIAFRFRGQISYLNNTNKTALPITTFSGLRKSVRFINYAPKTAALIVMFKETGASAFLKQPLHELFEKSTSLDNFMEKQRISIIEEQLAEAKNNAQRIAIVEQFLLSQLYHLKPDDLISAAIAKINSVNGIIKINELADMLYISNDAFEKRFRKIVGASPKKYSSIVRLQSIITQDHQHKNLTDIAFDAGYYDQSHFNKDFKLFTGQTPTDFFNSNLYW